MNLRPSLLAECDLYTQIATLLVSQRVSAMTTRRRDIPVTHIAYDEDNEQFLAYTRDGSLHSTYVANITRGAKEYKRDNSSLCTPLSADEVKTHQYSGRSHGKFVFALYLITSRAVPGYPQIVKYATDNWGIRRLPQTNLGNVSVLIRQRLCMLGANLTP